MRNFLLNMKNFEWCATRQVDEANICEDTLIILDISTPSKPDLVVCVNYMDMDDRHPSHINIDLSLTMGTISMDPDAYEIEIFDIFINLDTYNKLFSVVPFILQSLYGMKSIGGVLDAYDYMREEMTIRLRFGDLIEELNSDLEKKESYKRLDIFNMVNTYYCGGTLDIIFLLKKHKFECICVYDSFNGMEVENNILKYMRTHSKEVKLIIVPISICDAHVCITPDELYWLIKIQKISMMVELSDYSSEERELCDDSILELEGHKLCNDDEKYDIHFEYNKHVVGYDFSVIILLEWIMAITNEITYLNALERYYEVYIAGIKLIITIDDLPINIYVDDKDSEHFSPWVTIKQLIKEIEK